ncbi:MAG: hypothetical protein COB66_07925 [Coxiella sp. (in: Bacteria)]|nr:MAG: hypothetical protein COB66_07925 [Coxiella sp. (in: g-proteobacteria)]
MEKVTVKGKVYQIGGLYICNQGEIGILKSANENEEYPFVLIWDSPIVKRTKPCERIYTVAQSVIGTITDAPIELEDGEWYMCKFKRNEVFVSWTGELWCDGWGDQIRNDWQGDIVPIYKMVKA